MSLLATMLPILEGRRPPQSILEWSVALALRPLGSVYGWIGALRERLYQQNLLTTHIPPCPVISIGNLVSGGTGKTPMTLWLVRRLLEMGWKPAVVSRGYGHHSQETVTVVSDGVGQPLAPPMAADEATFLAERLPGVPVLCSRRRHKAITLAHDLLNCNLVVLDDGFQHLAVARHLDILLLDGQHPWGNGRLLPAGVLREPITALSRAHVAIITRCSDPALAQPLLATLNTMAPNLPVLLADHRPIGWRLLGQGVADPPNGRLLAFCGIARPDSFLLSLQQANMQVTSQHTFDDHHPYTSNEIAQLAAQARQEGASALVCTAKDAVKLRYLSCELPIYYLEVDLFFPQGAQPLLEEINRRLSPPPSSVENQP
ncbi:MAG: tetraacyldisaccharide 4'-kinase [Magnetococcales bacterium]|nr:tetraacyldisaccharide 4'-kinase [Magnetococcales bacterium]NGZ28257.1 tetraacyldisaccharide 4'-kinase [Magnetococcales bacterium]